MITGMNTTVRATNYNHATLMEQPCKRRHDDMAMMTGTACCSSSWGSGRVVEVPFDVHAPRWAFYVFIRQDPLLCCSYEEETKMHDVLGDVRTK